MTHSSPLFPFPSHVHHTSLSIDAKCPRISVSEVTCIAPVILVQKVSHHLMSGQLPLWCAFCQSPLLEGSNVPVLYLLITSHLHCIFSSFILDLSSLGPLFCILIKMTSFPPPPSLSLLPYPYHRPVHVPFSGCNSDAHQKGALLLKKGVFLKRRKFIVHMGKHTTQTFLVARTHSGGTGILENQGTMRTLDIKSTLSTLSLAP